MTRLAVTSTSQFMVWLALIGPLDGCTRGSSNRLMPPVGRDSGPMPPNGRDSGSMVADSGSSPSSDAGTSKATCGRTTKYGDRVCCGAPGEIPNVSCIDLTDGGTVFGAFQHCLGQSEVFDARQVGAVCCTGLMKIDLSSGVDGSIECGGPLSAARYCPACGDQKCDEVENRCNCPADCTSSP